MIFSRKNHCLFILIIGLLLLNYSKSPAQAPYVQMSHPVYSFIDRMEVKHFMPFALTATRPLSRLDVARLLVSVYDSSNQGKNLNKTERRQLEFFHFIFKEEIEREHKVAIKHEPLIQKIKQNKFVARIFPRVLYKNNRNFFSWQSDQVNIFFDPVYRYKTTHTHLDTASQKEKTNHFTNGFQIWGYLNNYLSFWVDVRDNKEWGTKTYQMGNYTLPGLGFVRSTSPDFIYHDETQAYIKLGFKNLQLIYGKFDNFWGNGRTGGLILSDQATSYDQFKLEYKHKIFKFTSIYAQLIDYHFQTEDLLQQKKYMAAHRLEAAPWNWLNLGLSETVIFKSRSFEPAYLNPVMFFRSAEHYLGSPDNMMMGMDFKVTAIRNLKIYGELLIDDITTTKLGTNWYGNKHGLLGGIYWAEPVWINNLDFAVEYVRIRPFTYTHEESIQHTHYGTGMGHWVGPNSDLLQFSFIYQPSMRLRLEGSFRSIRKGGNSTYKNFGGDIDQHWEIGDGFYPKFLDGEHLTRSVYGINISYELFNSLFFRFDLIYENNNVDSVLSENFSATTLTASVGINY
ncbi:hypothetical protein B6I21_00485 [candidate division KSB1 bacterium 4572_119]|nr:MAG: hypothetical protein B6I21_00485 [candidate division KSB1 bacterium 4572_119]